MSLFKENFTWTGAFGIALIVAAVTIVITHENNAGKAQK